MKKGKGKETKLIKMMIIFEKKKQKSGGEIGVTTLLYKDINE